VPKCQKIKNGGLDEFGSLKTLKFNHLASLGLKGLKHVQELFMVSYVHKSLYVRPWLHVKYNSDIISK